MSLHRALLSPFRTKAKLLVASSTDVSRKLTRKTIGKVYDVTQFVDEHPGGDIMLDGAGRDATQDFNDIGHGEDARNQLEEFLIGRLADSKSK